VFIPICISFILFFSLAVSSPLASKEPHSNMDGLTPILRDQSSYCVYLPTYRWLHLYMQRYPSTVSSRNRLTFLPPLSNSLPSFLPPILPSARAGIG
jgi:hypothetical protein